MFYYLRKECFNLNAINERTLICLFLKYKFKISSLVIWKLKNYLLSLSVLFATKYLSLFFLSWSLSAFHIRNKNQRLGMWLGSNFSGCRLMWSLLMWSFGLYQLSDISHYTHLYVWMNSLIVIIRIILSV
jgi:hypothetical protein